MAILQSLNGCIHDRHALVLAVQYATFAVDLMSFRARPQRQALQPFNEGYTSADNASDTKQGSNSLLNKERRRYNSKDRVSQAPRIRFQYNLKRKEIVFDPEMTSSSLDRMLQDLFGLTNNVLGVVDIQSQLVSPLGLVAKAPEMFAPPSSHSLLLAISQAEVEEDNDRYYRSAAEAPDADSWTLDIDDEDANAEYAMSPKGGVYRVGKYGVLANPLSREAWRRNWSNGSRESEGTSKSEIPNAGGDADDEDEDENTDEDDKGKNVEGAEEDETKENDFLSLLAQTPVFDTIHVDSLFATFQNHLKQQWIDRKCFLETFEKLLLHVYAAGLWSRFDRELRLNGCMIADAIFTLFEDLDTPGKVNIRAILSGMSFMCQGRSLSKIQAAFCIFERKDGQRLLSFEDLNLYLTAFMRVSFATNPEKRSAFIRQGVVNDERPDFMTPEEVGYATAKHCFQQSGKKNSDYLDFGLFQKWFVSGGVAAEESGEENPGASANTLI